MWNPFRRKSKQKKTLSDLVSVTRTMRDLERYGLVHWQVKDKLFLIEESLVQIWLALGEKKFKAALRAAAMWQNFQLIQEAYQNRASLVEAEAVRKAQKEHPDTALTDADINRIRQEARSNMPEIDPDTFNVIQEFDIMIIRAGAVSGNEATQASGQLIALGHFDGGKLELAMYDDIKHTPGSDADAAESN